MNIQIILGYINIYIYIYIKISTFKFHVYIYIYIILEIYLNKVGKLRKGDTYSEREKGKGTFGPRKTRTPSAGMFYTESGFYRRGSQ